MTLTKEVIGQMNTQLGAVKDSVKMHGKSYIMVKDRISVFRSNLPDWRIITHIHCITEDMCVITADIANPDGEIVATGTAQEFKMGSAINKTSYVENCETSAIGRALANLGLGIDDSYASADEVLQAEKIRQLSITKINKTDKKLLQTLCEKVGQDLELFFAFASKKQGETVETWDDITYASYGDLLRNLERKAGNL